MKLALDGDWELIGRGNHRDVFVHPHDKNKCIKIMHSGRVWRPAENLEHKYYEMLQKRGVKFTHIPAYYGYLKVSIVGEGVVVGGVFELIRDADGQISKSLRADEVGKLSAQMQELYEYLIANKIVSGNYKLQNIVVRRGRNATKLVLIDGIGNTDYIPLANYADWFARMKISRKWRRFLTKICYNRRPPIHSIIRRTL